MAGRRYTDGETMQEFIEVRPELMKDKAIIEGIREELKMQMDAWAEQKQKEIINVRYWIREPAEADPIGAKYEIWIEAKMGKPVK